MTARRRLSSAACVRNRSTIERGLMCHLIAVRPKIAITALVPPNFLMRSCVALRRKTLSTTARVCGSLQRMPCAHFRRFDRSLRGFEPLLWAKPHRSPPAAKGNPFTLRVARADSGPLRLSVREWSRRDRSILPCETAGLWRIYVSNADARCRRHGRRNRKIDRPCVRLVTLA
jgi:hypothetical protein